MLENKFDGVNPPPFILKLLLDKIIIMMWKFTIFRRVMGETGTIISPLSYIKKCKKTFDF